MTTAQTFAYALLLKAEDRSDAILRLLPENRREEVDAALVQLSNVDKPQLEDRWLEKQKPRRA